MNRLAVNCALIAGVSLAGLAQPVPAQSANISSEFEVVSIKLSAPGGDHGVWTDGPSRVRMLGMPLKQLIGFAYDVEGYRVSAQGSIPSEPYDVMAKVPDDAAKLPWESRWRQIHVMTQALLASRFKLTFHRAPTEMSVYSLMIGKGGSKIREVGPNPGDNVVVDRRPGHLSAQQMPMSQLVEILRGELRRPVLDLTGIKGVFDIKLDWAPEAREKTPPSTAERPETSADTLDMRPALSTAIEEQLGLKLQAGKSSIEVLVVDHAVRPSEN
jgi:uncharacterized protein (TIGR03435 family)